MRWDTGWDTGWDELEGGPELTVCRGCDRRFWSNKEPWCRACRARELAELRQGDGVEYDDGWPEDDGQPEE